MSAYVNPGQTKAKESGAAKWMGIGGGVVGGVLGGVFGNAPGAVAGAQAGKKIGGNVGEGISPSEPPKETGGATAQNNAMERRMFNSQQEINQPNAVLQESMMALRNAPPQVQQEYGPPINEAYRRLQYNQFMGRTA